MGENAPSDPESVAQAADMERCGASGEMRVINWDQAGCRSTRCRVPREVPLTIYVDGREWVTILCTPIRLNHLVVGFLCSQGLIDSLSDIAMVRVCDEERVADVRLSKPLAELPAKRTLSSGCGGGPFFAPDPVHLRRVQSEVVVSVAQVQQLMRKFAGRALLYRTCGGVHTSALCDCDNVLVVAEDIGRHNTLDKIQGECLLKGLSTRDRLLLTTGRVSSEMIIKAGKMGVPVVVSRKSPTDVAVSLAKDMGITLIGHASSSRLSVYSGSQRVVRSP